MKCPNCGTELLGAMKKCPKCGYNTESKQIDEEYLSSLEKSREQSRNERDERAVPSYKLTACVYGYYIVDGKKTPSCIIRFIDDTHIMVSRGKKNRSTLGYATAVAFGGLVGGAIYDAFTQTNIEDSLGEFVADIPIVAITEASTGKSRCSMDVVIHLTLCNGRMIELYTDNLYTDKDKELFRTELKRILGSRWKG